MVKLRLKNLMTKDECIEFPLESTDPIIQEIEAENFINQS